VAFCGGQVNGTALCQAPLYPEQTRCAQIVPGVASCVGAGSCTPSCDGQVARFCTDGGVTSFNCGLFGRGCVDDAGAPRCASGGACSEWQCSGQTLSSCIAGEIGPIFTCPSGTTCQTLSIGGYCETPGAGCTPKGGGDYCEGPNLHYCASGRDTAFDCRTVHAGWTCRQIGTLVTCAL
jgi:hypothetical protein